jgi:hypothetical protein
MNASYNAVWFALRYFAGGGVNISRLWPGSGLGFGFGAFFTSFLPLSLFPMGASVPQNSALEKYGQGSSYGSHVHVLAPVTGEVSWLMDAGKETGLSNNRCFGFSPGISAC